MGFEPPKVGYNWSRLRCFFFNLWVQVWEQVWLIVYIPPEMVNFEMVYYCFANVNGYNYGIQSLISWDSKPSQQWFCNPPIGATAPRRI